MEQFIRVVTDNGLGVASFVLLAYGLYQVIVLIKTLVTNHVVHLQQTIEKMHETLIRIDENTRKG